LLGFFYWISIFISWRCSMHNNPIGADWIKLIGVAGESY
jgi:hypothetical protein